MTMRVPPSNQGSGCAKTVFATFIAFVNAVGTLGFALMLIFGISRMGWFWVIPGVIYAVALVPMALSYAVSPKSRESGTWFTARILTAPSFAGLAEFLFASGHNWLGVGVMGIGALVTIALVLYAVVMGILSIFMGIVETENRSGPFHELSVWVWAQMDKAPASTRAEDHREMTDLVQFVCHSHPVIVAEALMGRALPCLIKAVAVSYISFFVALAVGLLVNYLVPMFTSPLSFLDNLGKGINIDWWTPLTIFALGQLVAASVVFLDMATAYWVAEYERTHSGLIVSAHKLIIVMYRWPSGYTVKEAPIKTFHQVQAYSPGETMETEAKGVASQFWDSWLKSRSPGTPGWGVYDLTLPVVAQKATVTIRFIADGLLVKSLIGRVALQLDEPLDKLRQQGMGKQAALSMDPTGDAIAPLGVLDGTGTLAQVEAIEALFPERAAPILRVTVDFLRSRRDGTMVDNVAELFMGDPGFWCLPTVSRFADMAERTGISEAELRQAAAEGRIVEFLTERGFPVYSTPVTE